MKEITIEEFGGEVKFTKYIASTRKIAEGLLNAIDLDVDDFRITPEEHTLENKRVDLVVRDTTTDNVIQVIECQDASGWLDPVHASKILWYSNDKKCNDVVIITEDMTEDMRNFVIRLNKESWVNIFVVSPTIIANDDKKFVYFKTLLRPQGWAKKTVRASNPSNAVESPFAEFIKEKWNEHRDAFAFYNTSNQRCYLSSGTIDSTGIKVQIAKNTKGFKNQIHHNGLHNTETFKETVKQQYPDAKFNTYAGHLYTETWEEAFTMYKDTVEFIKNGTIKHS